MVTPDLKPCIAQIISDGLVKAAAYKAAGAVSLEHVMSFDPKEAKQRFICADPIDDWYWDVTRPETEEKKDD